MPKVTVLPAFSDSFKTVDKHEVWKVVGKTKAIGQGGEKFLCSERFVSAHTDGLHQVDKYELPWIIIKLLDNT